jgi:hypothetical protein
MPGALAMVPVRRRRFADGGGTSGGALSSMTEDDLPTPPIPPQAPLASAADPRSSPSGGVLGSQMTPQQRAAAQVSARIKAAQDNMTAQAILAAGGAGGPVPQLAGMTNGVAPPPPPMLPAGQRDPFAPTRIPTFEGPEWSNLSMLAAAGAMLMPTHGGGFAESLGRGIEAGAQTAEQQRQLIENAALRAQQQDDMRAWRMGSLAVNQQRADTGEQREHDYALHTQAQSALEEAQAAKIAASAALAGARRLNEADLDDAAARSLVGTQNPDTGRPWTVAEARMKLKGIDIRQENADTARDQGWARIGISQDHLEWLKTNATSKSEADDALQVYKSGIQRDPGTGLPTPTVSLPDALKQVRQITRPPAPAAPAAPSAPAASVTPPATPAAPARPPLSAIFGN